MPEASLWSLVIALTILALGLTLKNIDLRRRLKHTEEDLSSARSKMKSLDERFDKEISDVKELYKGRIKELSEQFINDRKDFIHFSNLLWLADDPTPFCPRCYEADNKQIHMKLRTYLTKPSRFLCPQCFYDAFFSVHPNEKRQA